MIRENLFIMVGSDGNFDMLAADSLGNAITAKSDYSWTVHSIFQIDSGDPKYQRTRFVQVWPDERTVVPSKKIYGGELLGELPSQRAIDLAFRVLESLPQKADVASANLRDQSIRVIQRGLNDPQPVELGNLKIDV